jgi:hypothetical protein
VILYLLFVARRDDDTNLANISYDKIQGYTGIDRVHIRTGITLLGALSLVHVEHFRSSLSDLGVSSAYRLVGLDSYSHMGTKGRTQDGLLLGSAA